MSYRTVVVLADLSQRAATRIRLAAQLIRAHDAHLVDEGERCRLTSPRVVGKVMR